MLRAVCLVNLPKGVFPRIILGEVGRQLWFLLHLLLRLHRLAKALGLKARDAKAMPWQQRSCVCFHVLRFPDWRKMSKFRMFRNSLTSK